MIKAANYLAAFLFKVCNLYKHQVVCLYKLFIVSKFGMKVCKECKKEKSILDFPKAKSCIDGHTNKCKTCTKIYQRTWAKNNPDKVNKPKSEIEKAEARARAKKWYNENKDIAKESSKKWREDNPEKMNEYKLKWYKKNKDKVYLSVKNRRINYPLKYYAHCAVRYAIVKGDLINPRKCSICDSDHHVIAHHDDYLKPLTIRWLCVCCHVNWHKKNKALNCE